ncbi:MAG: hypothetical protein H6Q42_1251 [Deltaproteobacteria bacterium]|nr:hypothetical protein [Deltaproteobacteria bacterium]
MNLSFINPWFLFALAAGILPILIHRLTRRKALIKKFSAVRLLIRAQQNLARPQRLKHFLLLALRILTVVTLVFLVARPVLIQPGLLAMSGKGKTVILLDNSASMAYRDEGGERFETAKRAGKEIIRNLSGQILVIPLVLSPGRISEKEEARWAGTAEAIRRIDEILLSYGRGDAAAALNRAFRALKESKGGGNILILTDLTRGDWEGLDLSKAERVPAETGIAFLRIGAPKRDPNATLKEVVRAEGDAAAGTSSRLEATLVSYSDGPISASVSLFVGGVKQDQKSLELKAGEEGKISFDAFFEKSGWVDGEVRLGGDFLPLDDSFYFGLKVKEKIRVLIVDGDPKRALKASESYYLLNALTPGRGEESPFLPRVVTEKEWDGMDPRPFDALFLLNAGKPQGSRIASFLESGKPVFIFAGDQVIPGEYNRIPLFPWLLREIQGRGGLKPQRIGQIEFSHEALKDFSLAGGESLRSALFRRYLRLEGSAKNLLVLENGDPLLSRAEVGKGKIYFFASSADLDWTDLPLKGGYLPLIHGLLKEATAMGKDSSPRSGRFGSIPGEEAPPVQISGAQGGVGVYKFFGEGRESWRGVNFPLEESNLAKMTESELGKKFGSLPVQVAQFKEGGAGDLKGGRREAWPYLLSFLILVLVVEMEVAGRI